MEKVCLSSGWGETKLLLYIQRAQPALDEVYGKKIHPDEIFEFHGKRKYSQPVRRKGKEDRCLLRKRN